jgi:hypothetical protein
MCPAAGAGDRLAAVVADEGEVVIEMDERRAQLGGAGNELAVRGGRAREAPGAQRVPPLAAATSSGSRSSGSP